MKYSKQLATKTCCFQVATWSNSASVTHLPKSTTVPGWCSCNASCR